MKIDHGSAQQAYAAYRSQQPAQLRPAVQGNGQNEGESTKVQAPDRAEISAPGRLHAQTLAAARNTPDPAREQRIEELRQQVQAGTYVINDHQLAGKILQHNEITG